MSVDVVLWYMSWGGVALSACIEQFVPPHRAEHTREAFGVLSAAAAMFQLPVPWAAVVGLIVYAVLSSKGFEFAANPLPLLAVALFALSAVRLVSLPLVSELPVYLGAIVLVGSTPGGLALTLCQAWVPLSIALALVPRSRLFWLLCMVLASLLLFGVGGSRVPRKRVAVVAGVKVCVFAIVVGVFRPYLAQPASSGLPGRFGLPCTVKLGDEVATDAENRPCVVDGNPCPLSFNGTYDLVCGGARRGVCVPLDDAQNVCHCLPGSCGTESEVRFLPLKNRYFAFGCSDTAVACVNGSAPLDEPSDTDALRWMQPSNRCRCICDRDDVVGAACNLTCPKSAGGVICNGFPCTSNANETQAVCLCDASVSGSACQSYNCNGNGRIVDGQCVCNDNYYPPGANGSSAVCNSTCDGAQCSGHGLCVSADACVCDAGWTASSNCSTCDPALTTACGPIGACVNNTCTCPPKLDPLSLCETCVDPRLDPATNCTTCLTGYYLTINGHCAPCSPECAFVGCSNSTQCLCPPGFAGPTCACDEAACNNTGGACKGDTCDCGGRCYREAANLCGEPCEETTSCAQSTSVACCDSVSGQCKCPAAGATAAAGCVASIRLDFGH